jgi:hypothetical protein
MEVECVPNVSPNVLTQRRTNPRCQIAMTTEFYALAPNICGSSVWTYFKTPFWSFEFFRKFVHPCFICFHIDSLIKYNCHMPLFWGVGVGGGVSREKLQKCDCCFRIVSVHLSACVSSKTAERVFM